MRVIFDAAGQRWKVWFAVPLLFLCGVGFAFVGVFFYTSYGLDPIDGGVLKPLITRVLLGGLHAGGGMALMIFTLLYLQCYVTRIEVDGGDTFRVSIAGAGRGPTIRARDVVGAGFNDGVAHAGGIAVNAPWYTLRLRGRRLPLIVDLQGDFRDPRAVDRLMAGQPAPAAVEKPARKPRDNRGRRR